MNENGTLASYTGDSNAFQRFHRNSMLSLGIGCSNATIKQQAYCLKPWLGSLLSSLVFRREPKSREYPLGFRIRLFLCARVPMLTCHTSQQLPLHLSFQITPFPALLPLCHARSISYGCRDTACCCCGNLVRLGCCRRCLFVMVCR